jgi:hypothetical protein
MFQIDEAWALFQVYFDHIPKLIEAWTLFQAYFDHIIKSV